MSMSKPLPRPTTAAVASPGDWWYYANSLEQERDRLRRQRDEARAMLAAMRHNIGEMARGWAVERSRDGETDQ